MKLNELKPKAGSTQDRMRVGRGIGSGKGKTCGRGHKGQKARSGVSLKGFEGGQMPLYQRLPKYGFTNPFGKKYAEITPGRLQIAIDKKQIDAKKTIDEKSLIDAKIIRRRRDGIRLIGGGELKAKVELKITGGASKSAVAAVEKAGGKVEIVDAPKKQAKADKKPRAKKEAPKAKKAAAKKK